MILCIDIGNTRIKWARLTDAGVKFGGAHAYKKRDFFALLAEIWADIEMPERVFVSNVAGQTLGAALQTWVMQHWHIPTEVLTTQTHPTLELSYATPETLGVDRWLNMLAARQCHQEPYCIVDSGSFITVDIIDADGVHQGGYITPGLDMMYAALHHYSQGRLALSNESDFAALTYGQTSETCIQHGCGRMIVAFINDITQQVQDQYGAQAHYIITGGNAALLLGKLKAPFQHRPALVFEGMAVLA